MGGAGFGLGLGLQLRLRLGLSRPVRVMGMPVARTMCVRMDRFPRVGMGMAGVGAGWICQVDVEFDPFDSGLLTARGRQLVTVQFQAGKFLLEPVKIHTSASSSAPINDVATDAAECVQVKRLQHGEG